MIARTLSKTVVFSKPFLLKGVDRILPAGDYRVVTDEELDRRIVISGLPPCCDHDLPTGAISSSVVDRDGDH
jgi:hypothetical protein